MVDELLLQVLGTGLLRRPDRRHATGRQAVSGQTTTFDLIVLITLAVVISALRLQQGWPNAVVFVVTVFVIHRGLAALCAKSAWIRHLVRGKPSVLVRDGQVIDKALAREGISREELLAGLRKLGYDAPEAVKLAVLEETGHISAVGAADAIRPRRSRRSSRSDSIGRGLFRSCVARRIAALLGRIRSAGVDMRARVVAARPRMPGTMDVPLLDDAGAVGRFVADSLIGVAFAVASIVSTLFCNGRSGNSRRWVSTAV